MGYALLIAEDDGSRYGVLYGRGNLPIFVASVPYLILNADSGSYPVYVVVLDCLGQRHYLSQ
jgi:hypothetical protein